MVSTCVDSLKRSSACAVFYYTYTRRTATKIMSLTDADVQKSLKRTTANQHKKDSNGNGGQEQQALRIQLCRESMNKGTSSTGIPTSTTPLPFTAQESAGIRQNMRILQEEKFLEQNLFFKDANSLTNWYQRHWTKDIPRP